MRILITGSAGFVGTQLAQSLLQRGQLAGQAIGTVVLADQFAPPPTLALHPQVQVVTQPLLAFCENLRAPVASGAQADKAKPATAFDAVFHLASAVSGECETDFDLGLRSNLDSTRALLEALRQQHLAGLGTARLVFASSVAVFGPDEAYPLPDWVDDHTLPTPQTSYGMQKHVCEHLIADYSRKGFVDGRSARLMTVTVRPGQPNGAASSFFSGIIREPLAGREAICPVSPDVTHPVSSVRATVEGLIAVFEASRSAYGGRMAMNLPALNVSVQDMLDALERVAGPQVRARVRFERDERIADIVARWPKGAHASRATQLGLRAERSFEDIVHQYIGDCRLSADPRQAHSLDGLNRV